MSDDDLAAVLLTTNKRLRELVEELRRLREMFEPDD